jgi:hypothetical protein
MTESQEEDQVKKWCVCVCVTGILLGIIGTVKDEQPDISH